MASMEVDLAGISLRNPILSASGTFGHGVEMQHMVALEELGGLVSKTVTCQPRPGNPAPRIAETKAGFLNSIGLENRGIESYIESVLPEVESAGTVIITNIGGESVADYAAAAEALAGFDVISALEVNLSCPNVGGGRLPYSTDPKKAEEVLRAVSEVTDKPLWAKLSPNVTRIEEIACGAEAGGASAITAVNTLLGLGVDWRTGQPSLATVMGGYSGIGMGPVALRCAWQCAQAVDIPVVGCGGIADAEDVLAFLAVGCHAVQVGTASFSEPGLLGRLAGDVEQLLDEAGVKDVRDVVGCMEAS
ncbi:MAG: dihydroorotate dehydrogenase, partial [Planctomycetota bacterium]|nr:dihydroorotate dehydrogenase [Planctomycetota bacterium]